MGPTLLFDKSALQALSVDESVWLDQFFLPIICPLFFVETLADLDKSVRTGRTPEQEVGLIAVRTPEVHGYPTMFHLELCAAEIQGYPITMDGRPVIGGGKPVRAGNRTGMKYELPPEAEAFNRWQDHDFMEIERRYASAWRASLASLSFDEVINELKRLKIIPEKCKGLVDARDVADSFVKGRERPFDTISLAFSLLGLPHQLSRSVLERSSIMGHPPLSRFSPYVAYVLSIEVFFYIAIAFSLISKERASNKVDIAYLYYLPFCKIFVSGDKLHRKCAPLFLKDDQKFLWAQDLKKDLKALDTYFDELPQSEKEKGLFSIAQHPPTDAEFLVSELWDTYVPGWRNRPITEPPKAPGTHKKLLDHLKEFTEATPLEPHEVDFDPEDSENVSLARNIKRRKGKWWQVPKDLRSED